MFSENEIVSSFRQAADKGKQIEIFCQTELCEPSKVVEILVRGGVDRRTIPKKYRSLVPNRTAQRTDPDEIGRRGKRDMEDEIIERLDAQDEDDVVVAGCDIPAPVRKAECVAAQGTDSDETDGRLSVTLEYIRGLFARKSELMRKRADIDRELGEIKGIIETIVAASRENDDEDQ